VKATARQSWLPQEEVKEDKKNIGCKVCSPSHFLYHLLLPYRKVICVCVVILSSYMNMTQICIKKSFVVRFLYEYINQNMILVFSCIITILLLISCFYCFMFHALSLFAMYTFVST